MKCRLCGGTAILRADRGDVSLYRCQECAFVSGCPERSETPEQQYRDYYRHPAPASPDVRYQEWLARAERTIGRGRVLEVGAGSGGFVRMAHARGWSVEATEVSATAIDALRSSGARVFPGDVTAAAYPDGHFDLVVSLEVVEHVPDPMSHFRELLRITRSGGLLLLTTPNFNGLSQRGLGVRWRAISPEHLGYFTPSTLASALRQAGYRQVDVSARSLDILSWRRGSGPAGARAYDPHRAASLRDTIEGSALLKFGKRAVYVVLNATRLGDNLLVWAQR